MQYIITELECLEQNKVFEFLLDDDRNPKEIYTSVDEGIQVSDIYSGKVEKVLKNASACFVNIGGETVFLKYKDFPCLFLNSTTLLSCAQIKIPIISPAFLMSP